VQLLGSETADIAGAKRKLYTFKGTLNGQEFAQAGLPLIGPGYRIALIVHVSAAAAQANPSGMQAALVDVFARRIILPSRNP
jgi:hypothetical protein